MRTWIRDPLAIFAEGAERGIVVEGTRIAARVGRGEAPERIDAAFDASRHVVLPGLINAHHHFYQTLTRAHPEAINKPLFPWLVSLYPIWARLEPRHLRLAARLALAELLMSGCTTAADHHYLYPPGLENAVDIEVEEALALGIRMTVSRGAMNRSAKDGGLPPDGVVQSEDAILADSERVLKLYHDPKPGARIRIALAPCSPFSISKHLMSASARLAEAHDCRLHTHLCETSDEERFCLEMYGTRPVDLLEDTGWMSGRVWLAHGVHFDAREIARLGRAGVGVCHCAASNMVLASGICPACDLEREGVALGLGVDGSASNDSSNMMEAVRHALMLQRLRYGADKVTHLDALRWATEGSARCLGRSDIGRIEEGLEADLALFTLDEPRFSGAHDPLAALVLCGATRADRVMIGGEWRLVDGMPVGVDLGALMAAHREAARDFT
jgi:8-oxoguanine deaminase